MARFSGFSLASRGLKYKLRIAFYLMTILPLLVCVYLVSSYVLPKIGLKIDIAFSLLVSFVIAIFGFFLLKEIFDRVLSITNDAKLIAAGDMSRNLASDHDDEVGVLGNALNQLTKRIRSNMEELKSYSEKTTQINIDIQKKVVVLSNLLQISSMISQAASLVDILKVAAEKARLLANSDIAFLMLREKDQETFSMKTVDGFNADYLLNVSIGPREEAFYKISNSNKMILQDKENSLKNDELADVLRGKFKLNNILALPVYLRGRVVGILGIGNNKESFAYPKEDIELLDIFVKQIAIAIENDILAHDVKKLEIKDELTGLYNNSFIRNRLQEEIKRAIAYQRPCAFVLLDLDNFKKFHENFGSLQAEAALKKIAVLIHDSVTDIDRVGRTGDDEFAIILPEKNKRQAQEIANEIRKRIEFNYSEESKEERRITITAGVSENPLDGITQDELFDKAKELLSFAKKQGKNRVISFKE